MKWLKRMQDCIDYIEMNLKGTIDIDKLSQMTFLSRRYFMRMFEALTDMSVSEYIRNRKMTLATRELMEAKRKIIDIAFDYGYSSPEAFSRAFKSVHGISPSKVSSQNLKLKSYSHISFQISIKGEIEMNYKIEKKKAFKVLGKSIITTTEINNNFIELPNFWHKLYKDGTIDKMVKLSQSDGSKYGICMPPMGDNRKEFEYVIAVSYNGENKEDLKVFDIPEITWAVFECHGSMPQAIQKVWSRIFSEWLHATNYEINTKLPDVEYYSPGNNNEPDYYSEIWVPIITD